MIRPAVHADIQSLLGLCERMFNESAYAQVCEYSPEKMVHLLNLMVDTPDEYFLYVAEKDGTIIGMYLGLLTEYYFSKDQMAVDLALYVDREKRGGLAAVRLVQAFEDWAFERGAKEIVPATSTQVAPERTAQLYHLLGYEVVGNLFKKRR